MSSRFARTTILKSSGEYTTARLNLSSGEIKPFVYDRQDELVSAKPLRTDIVIDYSAEGDLLGYTPHWALQPAPNCAELISANFKPRVSKDNPNNVFLSEYISLAEAITEINMLDNLLEGVSMLDDGKSRPISKKLLFSMLRDLDVINSETVQNYTGYSQRHSQKLALYLRVVSNAFDMAIDRS